MAFILVEFAGQKTFGGYLSIDNGPQIQLLDNLLIKVTPGTHYINFSSQSSVQRGISKINVALGNYKIASWSERNSVDGHTTHTFEETEVMRFTVVSDSAGHILSTPQFDYKELYDEDYKGFEQEYAEQQEALKASEPEETPEERKSTVTELLLCLFLGTFGAHKFYKKKIGMGVLYLFTFGLFGIGYLVDLVSIIIRLTKK